MHRFRNESGEFFGRGCRDMRNRIEGLAASASKAVSLVRPGKEGMRTVPPAGQLLLVMTGGLLFLRGALSRSFAKRALGLAGVGLTAAAFSSGIARPGCRAPAEERQPESAPAGR